jgi:hypothetical protein
MKIGIYDFVLLYSTLIVIAVAALLQWVERNKRKP